jgi:hypothetical protein
MLVSFSLSPFFFFFFGVDIQDRGVKIGDIYLPWPASARHLPRRGGYRPTCPCLCGHPDGATVVSRFICLLFPAVRGSNNKLIHSTTSSARLGAFHRLLHMVVKWGGTGRQAGQEKVKFKKKKKKKKKKRRRSDVDACLTVPQNSISPRKPSARSHSLTPTQSHSHAINHSFIHSYTINHSYALHRPTHPHTLSRNYSRHLAMLLPLMNGAKVT